MVLQNANVIYVCQPEIAKQIVGGVSVARNSQDLSVTGNVALSRILKFLLYFVRFFQELTFVIACQIFFSQNLPF